MILILLIMFLFLIRDQMANLETCHVLLTFAYFNVPTDTCSA